VADGARDLTNVRIHPEPEPDERAVLERVLARLPTGAASPGPSAWWRTGVRENVAEPVGEGSA
jgi:hypothetical protein